MLRPLLVAVSLFACSPDLPAGEPLFAVVGGWCSGPCSRWTVFRDVTQLGLAVWSDDDLEKVNYGMLTPAGELALASAAQAFGPELVDDSWSCTATDGADYLATLERDGMRYTLRYCFDLAEFAPLTDLMMSIVTSLGKCKSNELVKIGECKT